MELRTRRYAWMCIIVTFAAATSVQGSAPKKKMPTWEEAALTYRTTMSVYNLGDWEQAGTALQDFIKKYPSHENVPLAYIQLAHCKFATKDVKAGEEALDRTIKLFPDSKAWLYAWGIKLNRARIKGDYDVYLKLYKTMVSKTGESPLRMSDRLDWRRYMDYFWSYRAVAFQWPYSYRTGFTLKVARTMQPRELATHLLEVLNTASRAEQGLKILDKTFKRHGQDLPVEWKFVHVILLRRAGEAEEAEKQLTEYLEGWPKGHPYAMSFWLLEAEHAQSKNDDKKADEIYRRLIETYPGYASLGERLTSRLKYLYRKRRHEDFIKLARWFLAEYPESKWRDTVVGYWIAIAKQTAAGKDTSQIPVVMKLLDEEEKNYRFNSQRVRKNLLRRIDLLLTVNKVNEAVELANQLVGKEHWSSESFRQVQGFAARHMDFQKVVDAARKKWSVPVVNPAGKAAALLKDLRRRMKDNQLRHMEEIGDEMFEDYHNDASTIEAIKILVDYYFRKVLYDKRDQWAERMIRAYPRHPGTQQVMIQQINAERGERNYKRLAPLVDAAMSHFPGASLYSKWFGYRIECYNAAKDAKGRIAFARRRLGKRAEAGEIQAIGQLGNYEEMNTKSYKDRGDYWMRRAKKYAGNYQEYYCLRRAFAGCYLTPRYRQRPNEIDFPSAIQVATALREQQFDPEMRWKMAFDDVNLLSQSNNAEGAARALAKRLEDLKETKNHQPLSHRLDMANFGRALASASLIAKAKDLISQLEMMCKTRTDTNAFNIMLAVMYEQKGKRARAAKYYLMAAKSPWPITQQRLHARAMRCLGSVNAAQYTSMEKKYINQIRTAQDLVPTLLWQLGKYHWSRKNGKKAAMSFFKKIVSKYPASAARGSVASIKVKK